MKTITKIGNFLTRNVALIIIVLSVIAFFVPQGFAWSTNYTSIFLGVIMFGMGLTIKPEDFRVVFTHPKEIVIGAVAQYTIMPLVGWLLAVVLHLPTDIALGVVLVGCVPGGTASNVITLIAGGDVPLSVGMTIVSTLLAPIMTPALVYLLAGRWVQVSFLSMLLSVVEVVLVPVILGLVVNAFAGKVVQKCKPILPVISVLAIAFIVAGITAANTAKILQSGLLVCVVVALHNGIGMALGWVVAKLFHYDYEKTTALAIEVGMQNSGLATSLAASNFAANPLATLPGAIFSIWHNIAGSIFANFRERHYEKAPETEKSGSAANAA